MAEPVQVTVDCASAGAGAHWTLPPAIGETTAITLYCRGAAQATSSLLLDATLPSQDHVKLLTPLVTLLALPALHRLLVGALKLAIPFAPPQTPTTLGPNVAVTVQAPLIVPVL